MREKMEHEYSAVITKGKIAFVAFCPELGVTSQGKTEAIALKNLKEATELYLEDEDIQRLLKKKEIQKAKIETLVVRA